MSVPTIDQLIAALTKANVNLQNQIDEINKIKWSINDDDLGLDVTITGDDD